MPKERALGEESEWGINLETVYCPKCNERMPVVRVPENLHQLMWGGWTCPLCGCQMDKWGNALEKR
jgi:hypothetical protein